MPKDDTERAVECGRRGEWEDDPAAPSALECLRAASFTTEQARAAVPSVLLLSAAASIDLAKASEIVEWHLGMMSRKPDPLPSPREMRSINTLLTLVP